MMVMLVVYKADPPGPMLEWAKEEETAATQGKMHCFYSTGWQTSHQGAHGQNLARPVTVSSCQRQAWDN